MDEPIHGETRSIAARKGSMPREISSAAPPVPILCKPMLKGTLRLLNNAEMIKNPKSLPKEPLVMSLLCRKAFHLLKHDHDALTVAESWGVDAFIRPRLRRTLERTADVFFFATLGLGVLGLLWMAWRPRDPGHLLLLYASLALALAPLAFFGDPRFHVPVLPLLAIFFIAWLVFMRSALTPWLALLIIPFFLYFYAIAYLIAWGISLPRGAEPPRPAG